MKYYCLVSLMFVLSSVNAIECPDLVSRQKDKDGMILCPKSMLANESLGAYLTCRLGTNKGYVAATQSQKVAAGKLFESYESLLRGVNKEAQVKAIQESATTMNLDVCRMKFESRNDSILVFAIKRGIKSSAAQFMLREISPSRLAIFGPHDGGDGTNYSTKIAFEKSNAMAVFSNAFKRNYAPMVRPGKRGDIARLSGSLGFVTMSRFFHTFPKLIVFHIHGMANSDKSIYRVRKTTPASKFINKKLGELIVKHSPVKSTNDNFNAGYLIDTKTKNQDVYVKWEYPTRWHLKKRDSVHRIINALFETGRLDEYKIWK